MCCYLCLMTTHTLSNCEKVKYMPISHFDDRLLFNHSKARDSPRFFVHWFYWIIDLMLPP